MLLNLRELYGKQQNIHLSKQIDISTIVKNEPSIYDAGPMKAEVDAQENAGNVVVSGQVEGELDLVCSRCLTVFNNPLKFRFEELFSNEPPSEDDAESVDEESFVNYFTEDKVDLVPYIEEHIVLELPRFPLCKAHCKGLCPSCGCNRNTETCSCHEEKTDPRWSGLKDLFQP